MTPREGLPVLPRRVKRVLVVLDDRRPVGLERHSDDVDANRLILEPMPPDIRRGKLRDPALFLVADRFGRVAVLGIGTAANLHEDDRAAVERDDVDVATQDPLASPDDPVAEIPQMPNRYVLTPTAKLVTGC